MTVAPRLLPTVSQAPEPPARNNPLRKAILGWQDDALDVVGCHGSAVIAFRGVRTADQRHDHALKQARLCLSRGEYARADYWVEQAQHHDAHEDRFIERIWSLFSSAADSCRRIVRAVEVLLGRAK